MPPFRYSRPRFTPRGERIYNLMLRLVAIPSITGSDGGENQCAQFLYDRLSHIPYFRENPDSLRLVRLEEDPLDRRAVLALLKAARPTRKKIGRAHV